MDNNQQIVPGVSVDSSGQATIDSFVKEILFDLAVNLEGPTGLPVDIQHVVAAIVLATRADQIDTSAPLRADDSSLIAILVPHVKSIFTSYDGNVGEDD